MSSPPLVSTTPNRNQLALALPQVLRSFDIAILLLDACTYRLQWHSPAVDRLIPSLASDGIEKIVERMSPSLSSLLSQSAKHNCEDSVPKCLSASLVATASQPSLSCVVSQLGPDCIAIQINDTDDHELQFNQ